MGTTKKTTVHLGPLCKHNQRHQQRGDVALAFATKSWMCLSVSASRMCERTCWVRSGSLDSLVLARSFNNNNEKNKSYCTFPCCREGEHRTVSLPLRVPARKLSARNLVSPLAATNSRCNWHLHRVTA